MLIIGSNHLISQTGWNRCNPSIYLSISCYVSRVWLNKSRIEQNNFTSRKCGRIDRVHLQYTFFYSLPLSLSFQRRPRTPAEGERERVAAAPPVATERAPGKQKRGEEVESAVYTSMASPAASTLARRLRHTRRRRHGCQPPLPSTPPPVLRRRHGPGAGRGRGGGRRGGRPSRIVASARAGRPRRRPGAAGGRLTSLRGLGGSCHGG